MSMNPANKALKKRAPSVFPMGFVECKACTQSGLKPDDLRRTQPLKFVGSPKDIDVQSVLGGLNVVIVGVGSIGANIAYGTARLLPRQITLIDPDIWTLSNILTSPISRSDMQRSKALAVGRNCMNISPDSKIYCFKGNIQEYPLHLLKEADVVFLSTDNLSAEIFTNDVCYKLQKTLIQASISGETLLCQIRLLANQGGGAPCLECLYSPQDYERLSAESIYRCDGTGTAVPTRAPAALCALAANMAVLIMLRHALHFGNPMANTMTQFCAYSPGKTSIIQMKRNPECLNEHITYTHRLSPKPLRDCSFLDLASAIDTSPGDVSVEVGNYRWLDHLSCGCEIFPKKRYFNYQKPRRLHCVQCDTTLDLSPYFSRSQVPLSLLGSSIAQPLGHLGIEAPTWLITRDSSHKNIFITNP